MVVAPYSRVIACDECGAENLVTTRYGYGPGEETDTGECTECGRVIVREKCDYIMVEKAARKPA